MNHLNEEALVSDEPQQSGPIQEDDTACRTSQREEGDLHLGVNPDDGEQVLDE